MDLKTELAFQKINKRLDNIEGLIGKLIHYSVPELSEEEKELSHSEICDCGCGLTVETQEKLSLPIMEEVEA